jgi:two-component system phosphate regulon sensor histidine kinase PhoR
LKRYRSLTTKLLIGYVSLLLIVFGSTSIVSEKLIGARFVSTVDESLLRQAKLIADSYPEPVTHIAHSLGLRVTIIDSFGTVLVESEENPQAMEKHLDRPEVKTALIKGQGYSSRFSSTLGTSLRYAALYKDGIIFRVAIPLTMVNNSLIQLRTISFLATTFAIFFGSIFAFAWNKKILNPLTEITDVAEAIARGNLSSRISTTGTDEIATLATSFNLMADRLSLTISDLTSERNKLNAVITSMADGLITIDRNKNITVINPQACNLFNFTSNPVGSPLWQMIRTPEVITAFTNALENGQLVAQQFSLWEKGERQMEIRSIPLKDENNQIIGAVGVIHDLTEIKRLERVRRDFVSNVSHELRTPLTSVNGFIETLRDNELDRETELHFLEIMYTETQRMINLISDLLTISRLESGHTTLKKTVFPIEPLWRELEMLFLAKADQKGLILDFQGKLDIYGDRDQIKQILINLIDNAIKYSDKGSIKITAKQNQRNIILSVTDKGSGIPPEEQSRLFERFYRVDKARSRAQGGTGLGLSIVKHIAEEHNGKPFVRSNPGEGSTFGVELPLPESWSSK